MAKRKLHGYALSLVFLSFLALQLATIPTMAEPAERQAFYGETHVHTKLSFDAFIFGNRNGPTKPIVLPRARKYSTLRDLK